MFVPIASIESQRLLPLHTPSNSLRSFRCPTLGGHASWDVHTFQKGGGELVGGEGGSRALFSDNVSRIETALKQPINGVGAALPSSALGANFVRFQEIVVASRNGVAC